jgi:hypothetical protein
MAVKMLAVSELPNPGLITGVERDITERETELSHTKTASPTSSSASGLNDVANGTSTDNSRPTKIMRLDPQLSNYGTDIGSPRPDTYDLLESTLLLRFSRSSQKSWSIRQTKVFDMHAFLRTCRSTIFLVDYSALSAELVEADGVNQTRHNFARYMGSHNSCSLYCKDGCSFVSLGQKLMGSNAIIASWEVDDYPQLLRLHQRAKLEGSWIKGWRKGCVDESSESSVKYTDRVAVVEQMTAGPGNSLSSAVAVQDVGGARNGVAVLAIEQSIPMILLLRGSKDLGLNGDCWRYIYTDDLVSVTGITITEFLSTLFPQFQCSVQRALGQLRVTEDFVGSCNNFVVKYFPHDCGGLSADAYMSTATELKPTLFQTIGLLSHAADKVLSNFVNKSHFSSGNIQTLCHELFFEKL